MTLTRCLRNILGWVSLAVGCWAGWPTRANPPSALTDTHDVRVFDSWDGLPYFAVSGLAATPDGRLWIATFRDLACYDGIGFRSMSSHDAPGFAEAQSQVLTCDRKGRLWMGGGAMLGVMEGDRWRFLGADHGVPRVTFRSLAVLASGDVWAAWEGGILRLQGDRAEVLEAPPETGSETCGLLVDEGDRLWCSNQRGLWWRDGDQWRRQEGPAEVGGQAVCGIGPARGGGVWVAWEREAWRFQSGSWGGRKERPPGMLGDAVTLLEDRRGGLWLGGWASGLARFGIGGEVEVATAGIGFRANSVTSLLEDVSGNVWVGSNGGSVARIRPLSFRIFGSSVGLGAVVNSIAEEEPGVMAVGTHGGGLLRWRDGVFEPHPTAGKELGDGVVVQSVWKDRSGDLWVGTFQRGLMRGRDGRWEAISAAETGAQIIRTLHEDRAGRLWVGTAAGVAVREAGRFRVLGESDGIPHMVVHGMGEDAAGRMWVCGMGYGLFRMSTNRFERVAVAGLPERARFACLASGKDGSMWVGVMGDGVVRVKDGNARLFGRVSGLMVGDTVALHEDGEGSLWVWTTDRCQQVSTSSFEAVESGKASRLDVRVFDRRDGFPGPPRVGFHPVVVHGKDGRQWWATVKGLAELDVRRMPLRVKAPGVAWRWLRDGSGEQGTHDESKGMTDLGRPKGVLDLGFRSERFGAAEHVQYEARLLPNGTWQGVMNTHRLSMQDLRPGRYRLEVRASERDGEWGAPSAVGFEVPTPLWQQKWFLGTILMGSAGAAVGVARIASLRRMRARMRRLEQETLLERERTRISQNLHDDLGASMTRVALLLERACRVEAMPREAMERVKEGLQVARGTMGSLDAAVWAVDPSNDSWSELVGYLGQMVVEFCQSAGMKPVLDLPEQPEERKLGAEWRHHAVLIVKEAVNNAVKHSGGSQVRLRVALVEGGMELEVVDDGRGLPEAQGGGGRNGLTNLMARARSMGGRLEIRGTEGQGTTVSAFIPWPGGQS